MRYDMKAVSALLSVESLALVPPVLVIVCVCVCVCLSVCYCVRLVVGSDKLLRDKPSLASYRRTPLEKSLRVIQWSWNVSVRCR